MRIVGGQFLSSEGILPFLSGLQHQQDPQPGAFVPSPSVKTFLWYLSQASFWLMPWLMCLLSAADQSWHLNRNSVKIFMFYKMINISKKSGHKILTIRNQLSTFTKMASGTAFVISSFDDSNVRNTSIAIISTSSISRCVFADLQTLIWWTQKWPDCTNEARSSLRPN